VGFNHWCRILNDIIIAIERPDQPDVRRLLEAGDALSASLYPAESNHMLDASALLDPAVTFLVARQDGVAIGCGALVRKTGYAEIKRMFVDEAARGRKIGRRILDAVEAIARAEGIAALKLETGIYQPAAIGLYRSAGFEVVPPFGDYRPDPLSVFMSKALA
jgi:putative acetyltransferase